MTPDVQPLASTNSGSEWQRSGLRLVGTDALGLRLDLRADQERRRIDVVRVAGVLADRPAMVRDLEAEVEMRHLHRRHAEQADDLTGVDAIAGMEALGDLMEMH